MKRTGCLFLAALLFCCAAGCHYSDSGDILEPVEFCYPRHSDHFIYGGQDGIWGSEIREASGHIDDLNYLLSMYMRGPQSDHLRSPFPAQCRIQDIRYEDDTICLALTENFTNLENAELTIACASLAKTCFSISDAERVQITAVSASKTIDITLDKTSFLPADDSAAAE